MLHQSRKSLSFIYELFILKDPVEGIKVAHQYISICLTTISNWVIIILNPATDLVISEEDSYAFQLFATLAMDNI